MPCLIHSSSDFTVASNSGYLICATCLQQSEGECRDTQYQSVYGSQPVPTDGKTQQGEQEDASDETEQGTEGELVEACKSSHDNSASTNANGFNTPSSSSGTFETDYKFSHQTLSFSNDATGSWDDSENEAASLKSHPYSITQFLANEGTDGPWSTYNLRTGQAPEPADDSEFWDNEPPHTG